MDIRVALLGGDELVRRGLDSMLKTLGGFELGTIKDRSRLPVDIALVETFGTARSDTTLQRAVTDPHIRRVAVYTWNHQPGLAHEPLGNGVTGYLAKSLNAQQLGRALRAIHLGETVVAPLLPVLPTKDLRSTTQIDFLTAREREIAALVGQGHSNRAIADTLVLSERTVESHVSHILAKLGLETRAQVVAWAQRAGLA